VQDERGDRFLDFELRSVWERFNALKARDFSNYTGLVRLYGLMILYASAPFYFAGFGDSGLLRIWGFGGVWLAGTTWFVSDRNFRSYGFHLKERMLCLKQLAIVRSIEMANNPRYLAETLLPLDAKLRRRGEDRGFPERISPGAIDAASYFFKFLSLFPLMYLYVFIGIVMFPEGMVAGGFGGTLKLFIRLLLAGSCLFYFWIYVSSARCVHLQRLAFTARRITPERPWPTFPRREAIKAAGQGRVIVRRCLVLTAGLISALNFGRGIQLMASRGGFWETPDIGLAGVTVAFAVLGLVFSEVDIRRMIRLASGIEPLGVDATTKDGRGAA